MTAQIALFDLGRVVLDWEPARLYSRLLPDAEERERFLSEICTMAWHTRHDAGVSFADNAPPLIAQYPHYEAEIRAWGGRWMEMFDGYIDGTPALIDRLEERGVPLYALSNMPSETWPLMLEHFPLVKRFRHTVVSGDIGLVKPDPAIFMHALEKLGNPAPGEVFFIDDSEKNITAADALGFRTHLFRSAEGLETALKAEGLL
ncbi:HAD family hydrolase [Hyphomonas jannaschiana]|uniref:HAD family hydrolase n=1 Tax=Hyphomonas jannaschiana VP2 TaxID=1280952 RepID=A0A059F7V1_9PROT|nr:HAD family phosphatase [Hyphomonas jannaschiana]KCZ86682.1 HAD family hydrolase [Hyphomonas jannaschiana VP2]